VLGADVVVLEEPSFLLGEDDDASCSVGEPLKQAALHPLSILAILDDDHPHVHRRPPPG
jgi:hypothetical protein